MSKVVGKLSAEEKGRRTSLASVDVKATPSSLAKTAGVLSKTESAIVGQANAALQESIYLTETAASQHKLSLRSAARLDPSVDLDRLQQLTIETGPTKAELKAQKLREIKDRVSLEHGVVKLFDRDFDCNESIKELKLLFSNYKNVQKISILSVILLKAKQWLSNESQAQIVQEVFSFIEYVYVRFQCDIDPLSNVSVLGFACQLLSGNKSPSEDAVIDLLETIIPSLCKQSSQDSLLLKNVINILVDTRYRLRNSSTVLFKIQSFLAMLQDIGVQNVSSSKRSSHVDKVLISASFDNCMPQLLKSSNPICRYGIIKFLSQDISVNSAIEMSFDIKRQTDLTILLQDICLLLSDRQVKTQYALASNILRFPPQTNLGRMIFTIVSNKVPIQSVGSLQPELKQALCNLILNLFLFGDYYQAGREGASDPDVLNDNLSPPTKEDTKSDKNTAPTADRKIQSLMPQVDAITLCDILNFAQDYMADSSIAAIMADEFCKFCITESSCYKVTFAFKRLILDGEIPSRQFIDATLPTYLQKMADTGINAMSSQELEHIKYLLYAIHINFEQSLYYPFINLLSASDYLEVAGNVKLVSFLNEVLGEVKLWFGLDGWFQEGSQVSMKSDTSEAGSKSKAADKSLAVPKIPQLLRAKAKEQYVELMSLILLGVEADCKTSSNITLGRFALYLELISVMRQIRLALKQKGIIAEVREAIKSTLMDIELRIYAYLKIVETSGHELCPDLKCMVSKFLVEVSQIKDHYSRSQWIPYIVKWVLRHFQGLHKLSFNRFENADGSAQNLLNLALQLHGAFVRYMMKYQKTSDISALQTRIDILFPYPPDVAVPFTFIDTDLLQVFTTLLASQLLFIETPEIVILMPEIWQMLPNATGDLLNKLVLLFMYFADNAPAQVKQMVYSQLYHNNPEIRKNALACVGRLFNHRDYIQYQSINDKNFMRISSKRTVRSGLRNIADTFKVPTLNLPFVISEHGEDGSLLVNESEWVSLFQKAISQRNAQSFIDFKKEKDLSAMHHTVREWVKLNQESMNDDKEKRIETKLTMQPTTAVADRGKLGSMRQKRFGALFPMALNLISFAIVDLTLDCDVVVQQSAYEFLHKMIRDDPGTFLRMYFSEMTASPPQKQLELLSRLKRIVFHRKKLSYGFAYLLLNFCIGYCQYLIQKHRVTHYEVIAGLLPIMSHIYTCVKGLTFADLKRMKLDLVFTPSMDFWYGEKQIEFYSAEFEQKLPKDKITNLSLCAHRLQTLRLAQYMLTINILNKYPSESDRVHNYFLAEFNGKQSFGQTITRSQSKQGNLDQFAFQQSVKDVSWIIRTVLFENAPVKLSQDSTQKLTANINRKVWLNLLEVLYMDIDQAIVGSKYLTQLMSHVSALLFMYSYDYELVKNCLNFYALVVTKFVAKFAKNGYKTFIKELFLYCVLKHTHARNDGFEIQKDIYLTWNTMFAIHRESFVMQCINSLVPMINDWKEIYQVTKNDLISTFNWLFSSLNARNGNILVEGFEESLSSTSQYYAFDSEELIKLLMTLISQNLDSARSYELLQFMQSYSLAIAQEQGQQNLLSHFAFAYVTMLEVFAKSGSVDNFLIGVTNKLLKTSFDNDNTAIISYIICRVKLIESFGLFLLQLSPIQMALVKSYVSSKCINDAVKIAFNACRVAYLNKYTGLNDSFIATLVDGVSQVCGVLAPIQARYVIEVILQKSFLLIRDYDKLLDFENLWTSLVQMVLDARNPEQYWPMFKQKNIKPLFDVYLDSKSVPEQVLEIFRGFEQDYQIEGKL
ncbi:hypothetical protein MIR68_010564 [Amoeboaphelidium protococcarum]|nr:hypothetical protein MIR68_010564 [Amoeboaphelidium protococcarum]